VEAVDFVRAVTVVSVVGVHATWYMAAGGQWLASAALLALLHYTRESFMILTGFVLTHSLYGRPVKWRLVLKRRYRLVLFPYLIWTAIYMLAFRPYPHVGGFALCYGHDLLTGGGWFHLYYLLITIQFYATLPLFLGLMRIAQRRPLLVTWSAIVFEVVLTSYDQYRLGARPQGINAYTGMEVWSYAGYFILGGVAAVHWSSVREWLKGRLPATVLMTAGTALAVLAEFFLQVKSDGQLWRADAVLQPVMVPWSLGVVLVLGALGVRYEDALTKRALGWQLIKWVAEGSFGIYLIHPLLLQIWSKVLAQWHWSDPSYMLDIATVVLLVLGSGAAAHLMSWTPVGVWVVGRSVVLPRPRRAIAFVAGRAESHRSNWNGVRPRRKSPP
jgi:peptidoglycan/LPS O-acetylase OafA/YrhL